MWFRLMREGMTSRAVFAGDPERLKFPGGNADGNLAKALPTRRSSEAPRQMLVRGCGPEFLGDTHHPVRAEADRLGPGGQAVARRASTRTSVFALDAWYANGHRWTTELAEALTLNSYNFLKHHGLEDWFMGIVRRSGSFTGRSHRSGFPSIPDDPGYRDKVDAFLRGIEAMEADPELNRLDGPGDSIKLLMPWKSIPPIFHKHRPFTERCRNNLTRASRNQPVLASSTARDLSYFCNAQ